LRLAIISPFVDRRHGTERCLAEQLERFVTQPDAEIHLYAQRVADVAGVVRYPAAAAGRIVWHRVPRLRGPHLLGYIAWFAANHLQRWWDARIGGLKFDLTYSAGINAFDADAISIHVLFAEFYRRVRPRLLLGGAPIARWPVILHRRLYYGLICRLERRVYPRGGTALTAISQHTADCTSRLLGRQDVRVIRYGVETATFQPRTRLQRRESARDLFHVMPGDFCVLLIGNDWKSKGLDALLRALSECSENMFRLLVAGTDDPRDYADRIRGFELDSRVHFLSPSQDVMQFYAASDAYVAPSLEDAYGLPILEAMACGLPVIASVRAGASEIVRDRENGLLLRDPEDSHELAALLRTLHSDAALRERLGVAAAQTAACETWDRNAADTWKFLEEAFARKVGSSPGHGSAG
jgi:glycosyltransferase involved in cell wall biosynthesis